jgi:arginine decarboxylase
MVGGNITPKFVFFTKGVGHHKDELHSFESALRDAGIEKCNLVYVSSILPPGCEVIAKNKGLKKLSPGCITFCVMSKITSNENRRMIAAAVGCAVPKGNENYGYLSEHHAFGQTTKKAGDYAEDLAASMLASTLGVEFDIDSSWDEKEELFKISGKFITTKSVSQSAYVKEKSFTTVIAAAVFTF